MKLILPKEHGAWAMWIAPYIIGFLVTDFHWFHILLFISIFFAYISISPFLQGIKRPSDRKEWWKLSFTYLAISFLLSIPFLIWFPKLLSIILMIIPFFLINLYFAKQKKERALFNDFSAMVSLTSTLLASYYIGSHQIDERAYYLWLLNLLFFFGTALFVKTLYREKENKRFKWVTNLYMIFLPLLGFLFSEFYLILAYLFSMVKTLSTRAGAPLTPKRVGILEIINTIWFIIFVVLSVK
ncbi:YwiC-like family protein [Tepidibacillus decaturensis]|uniref:YwiC-like protein n=1 Tax=Tepidibacillus decaturensis TaxID=1413211 RepID=A0A135L4T5_9BACI|nr:YwiC-like family protein [Tepidibacillus decaturensis]KXG43873.1 hypothetical protein U473_07535 [Tepidibacillus decaturensis]